MDFKKKINDYFHQEGFKKKFIVMLLGVVLMGVFLSFLIEVSFGTDPCTFMNLTIAGRLGILFGTWQVILNSILFILVIFFDRHQIGPGTIANMVLIGYISDFCRWLWGKLIPDFIFTAMPYRAVVFVVALLCFVVAASLYMNADMGVAPYDAVPIIINRYVLRKVPFKYIRIGFDGTVLLIGFLLGGKVEICTVLMVFLLGPTITAVGSYLNRTVFKF
jgi:uncharacterized membrane protein YczE